MRMARTMMMMQHCLFRMARWYLMADCDEQKRRSGGVFMSSLERAAELSAARSHSHLNVDVSVIDVV